MSHMHVSHSHPPNKPEPLLSHTRSQPASCQMLQFETDTYSQLPSEPRQVLTWSLHRHGALAAGQGSQLRPASTQHTSVVAERRQ